MVDDEEITLLKLSRYPQKGYSNEKKGHAQLRGIHIPGMTLKTQLAIGQQGSVYQAIIDGNEVAIKIDKIPRGIEGVPSLIQSSESDSYLYFTMPLLGKDLESYTLNHSVQFPLECALCLGIELVIILKQIHSKGILHQDIKPANITIGSPRSQRSVYIIDFGSAQQFEDYT